MRDEEVLPHVNSYESSLHFWASNKQRAAKDGMNNENTKKIPYSSKASLCVIDILR
jgi:hypothetical protein